MKSNSRQKRLANPLVRIAVGRAWTRFRDREMTTICKVLNAIDAGHVYETPDGKIGTLPEDANTIRLASAKAEARTADTKDE